MATFMETIGETTSERIDRLEYMIDEISNEFGCAAAHCDLVDVQVKLRATQVNLVKMSEQLSEVIRNTDSALNVAFGHISTLEQTVQEQNKLISGHNAELKQLYAMITEKNEDLQNLRTDMNKFSERIATYENRLTSMQKQKEE